jgi:Domain of unknown function (DUF4258)
MAIERFQWTQHAEQRLGERNLTRGEVEQAIRDGHGGRQINTGSADWRVHGRRSDGKSFEVVYDNPADGDAGAARIISEWPVRTTPAAA